MSSPNVSGGTDTLAYTGVGPGTLILAVVGIAMTLAGAVARRFSRSVS